MAYVLPGMWDRVVALLNVFWAWDAFKVLILIPVVYFIAPMAFRVFTVGVPLLADGIGVGFDVILGLASPGVAGILGTRGYGFYGHGHFIRGYRWWEDQPDMMEERVYEDDADDVEEVDVSPVVPEVESSPEVAPVSRDDLAPANRWMWSD